MQTRIKKNRTILTLLFLGTVLMVNAQMSIDVLNKITDSNLLSNAGLDTLPALNVTASRIPVSNMPHISELTINAGKKNEVIRLENVDANTVNNITRQIFARVPGISIWENDGSGIQIGVASRGLSPNRSWEFNNRQNGYDISSDPLGYPESYYNPPTDAVEQIQIIRGASSLQYGPQFGGLLNYIIKKGAKDKPLSIESNQTVGSYGLFGSFNAIGGTVGKLNYYGYYNYKQADGWRDNGYYRYQTGLLSANYQLNAKLSIGAEFTRMNYKMQQAGGLTDAQFAENARQSFRERNWFGTPTNIWNVNLNYQITDKTKLNLKVFGFDGERNSVGFVRAITILDTINLKTGSYNNRQVDRDWYNNVGAEARLLTEYTFLNKKHNLAAGVRYFNGSTRRAQNGIGDTGSDFNLAVTGNNGTFPRDVNFKNQNIAAFVENVFTINDKFILIPGARIEGLTTEGSGRFSYKTDGTENKLVAQQQTRTFALLGIGAEYHLTEETEFYTNIAQTYRPITFGDVTPPATTDVIDPDLKDASGYNFDFGYRGRVKDWLTFDASAFFMKYDNRIGTLTQLRADSTTYQFRTNIGTSIHKGIECYVDLDAFKLLNSSNKWGSLHLWASISFIDAQYTKLQTAAFANKKLTVGDLKGNRVENAAEYIHRFGFTYSKQSFSATWQMSSVGDAFADANNTVTPSVNGQIGLIPAYKVMDLSTTFRFFKNYTLKAGVNNLTNTKYFTRRAGGYPGPGILPNEGRSFYITGGVKF